MKVFDTLTIFKKYKRSSLAIGNFDGVHKGHQKVFKQGVKFAKKLLVFIKRCSFLMKMLHFCSNFDNFKQTKCKCYRACCIFAQILIISNTKIFF